MLLDHQATMTRIKMTDHEQHELFCWSDGFCTVPPWQGLKGTIFWWNACSDHKYRKPLEVGQRKWIMVNIWAEREQCQKPFFGGRIRSKGKIRNEVLKPHGKQSFDCTNGGKTGGIEWWVRAHLELGGEFPEVRSVQPWYVCRPRDQKWPYDSCT